MFKNSFKNQWCFHTEWNMVCVVRVRIFFSATTEGCCLDAELRAELILSFVHNLWVMIQNMDWGCLWLTLRLVTDLARAQTLAVSCCSTLLLFVILKLRVLCGSTMSGLCLFPWPPHTEVKQHLRARNSGSWMERCFFFTKWCSQKPYLSLSS